MSKLTHLRQIGETMAHIMHADIIGSDDVAFSFFKALAEEMYPANKHRREWAGVNLQTYYDQEKERIQIMKKLTNKTTGQEMVDAIRARQEAEEYRESLNAVRRKEKANGHK